MSRDALLAAVAADPDADLPRLVYADWLDDHADPDRAEFIRLQCATARSDPTDPDWLPRKLREYELFDCHRAEWNPGGVDEIANMLASRWRRGFPDWVPVDAPAAGLNGRYHVGTGDDPERHLAEASRRAGGAPFRGLSVSSFGPHLEPVLRADWCRTVREVLLMAWYASCDVPEVDAMCRFLAALPADHWPDLRQLSLSGHPSDDGLRVLADAPATGRLTAIELWLGRGRGEEVSAAALDRFAQRAAPHLEELDLYHVTAEQAAAVASVRWPKLRRLILRWTYPGAVTRLLTADLPALAVLSVHFPPPFDNDASVQELRRLATALAAAPLVARLSSLTLSSWPVDSLTDFGPAYRGKPLDRFGLLVTGDSAYAPRLADLSRLPTFRELKTLDLFRAWGGLPALADPAVFPELHSIRLGDRTTPRPTAPLRWRGGERRLVFPDGGIRTWSDAYMWTAD